MRTQCVFLGLVGTFAILAANPAFAQTQATGTNTVSSTLQVSATVAKALQLTLSTGTQCAVAAGATPPDYTMSFGTVDALGISAGACGAKYSPTTPGTSPAVYFSDYKIKPIFTSQSAANNTITAYVSTDFGATAAGLLTIVQANAAPSAIGDFTAMSKLVGSQTSVATNVGSGVEVTRYIGVSVAPLNTAGTLTGSDSARITYTLTVQ
jgi:hypothetical protein